MYCMKKQAGSRLKNNNNKKRNTLKREMKKLGGNIILCYPSVHNIIIGFLKQKLKRD